METDDGKPLGTVAIDDAAGDLEKTDCLSQEDPPAANPVVVTPSATGGGTAPNGGLTALAENISDAEADDIELNVERAVPVVRAGLENLGIDAGEGAGDVEMHLDSPGTQEGINCSPQCGPVRGGEAIPVNQMAAGTSDGINCSHRGDRAAVTPSSGTSATKPNENEIWRVVEKGRKRVHSDESLSFAHRLVIREAVPLAWRNMNISNGEKGDAPAYFDETRYIRSPREVDGVMPFMRELVCLDDVLKFRSKTRERALTDKIREKKKRLTLPQGPERMQAEPVPMNGDRPMLYRVTPFFKGSFWQLEAVHFETFIEGRGDLRIIQLDHFSANVDGHEIRRTDCTVGDLFWIYEVSIQSARSLEPIKEGKVDVNRCLDEGEFFPMWAADLVAPLPRKDTFTSLCRTNVKVTDVYYDYSVPGNAEPCRVLNGPKLNKNTYVNAVVRKNEAGWCYPVEVVPEEFKKAYLGKIQHIRSVYRTTGPFILSVEPVDEAYLDLLKDKTTVFKTYGQADKQLARDLISDTMALGGILRSQSEVTTKKRQANFVVVGFFFVPPKPAEIQIEVLDTRLSLDQIEKIVVYKNGPLPQVSIKPKSVEMGEDDKTACVVGTLDPNTGVNFFEFLESTGFDLNENPLACQGHIVPKVLTLDPIALMTSEMRIGDPIADDQLQHVDRLYGQIPHEPLLAAPDQEIAVPLKRKAHSKPTAKEGGKQGGGKEQDQVGDSMDESGAHGDFLYLNPNQTRAIHEVENGRKTLIVNSPPGSGKTRVAVVMAVRASVRDKKSKTLLTAVTNSGVKTMADALSECKLDENTRPLRTVSARFISRMGDEEKSPLDLDTQLPVIMGQVAEDTDASLTNRRIANEYLGLLEALRDLDKATAKSSGSERADLLRDYAKTLNHFQDERYKAMKIAKVHLKPNIILATIDYSILRRDEIMKEVGLLIIDECSQVTEAQLLCLLRAAPNAAVVLVGDPLQLNPHRFDGSLAQSLAGRSALTVAMQGGGYAQVNLDRVYRATPPLTTLYSHAFYEGKLDPVRPLPTDQQNPLVVARMMPHGATPLSPPFLLLNTSDTNVAMNATRSLKNEKEIRLALKAILTFLDHGVTEKQIMIICLYAYQQLVLRQRLQKEGLNIEVLTVDSAQGREREVVLLLTTRVKGGRSTFFEDARRVNVAVSRQKDALVVFGNPSLLNKFPAWNAIVAPMEKQLAVRRTIRRN